MFTKLLLYPSQTLVGVKNMSPKQLKLTSISDYWLFSLLLLLKLLKQTAKGFTMLYVSDSKNFHSSVVSEVLGYAKAISLICASSLLIACGGGGSSEPTEQAITPETFTTIQGSAMKGAIVNGIVRAYLIEPQAGAMVKSDKALEVLARTNVRGEYQFKLPGQYDHSDIIIEVTADSQTRMTCDVTAGCGEVVYGDLFPLSDDFSLKTAVTGVSSGEIHSAHLSPLTHMALAYASSNSDGFTSTSISNAFSHVETLMDLEQGAMQLAPADITDLERYPDLSKSEIEMGVISAAFLGLVNSPDWGSIEEVLGRIEEEMSGAGQLAPVNVGTSPSVTLDDLFYNAAQISGDLLEAAGGGGHAEALSAVSAETTQSYQEISEVPQAVHPVVISTHPQVETIDEGEQASFSVAASGGGTLSFQWQKNGADILGENGSSLIVASAQLVDEGSYAVIVSNSVGSVVSFSALLIVQEIIESVKITSQPKALVVVETAQANFSVEAVGGGDLVYQWRKGGVAIAGATSASLNFSDVALSDAGSYDLVVSNSVNSVTSAAVSLLVNKLDENKQDVINPVEILSQPQSLAVSEGEQAAFSVTAEGGGELSYQWRKDGVEIQGATDSSLVLGSAVLSDAGLYDVVISNSESELVSTSVSLGVNEILRSIQLSWETPLKREDGTDLPIYEINGYVIKYGSDANSLDLQVDVLGADTDVLIELLEAGTYYFAIATIDSDGVQGSYSPQIQKIML